MSAERWPGYNSGQKPPGATVRMYRRPARSRAWHLEVTWDGLVYDDEIIDRNWIDLGPVTEYLHNASELVDQLDWAAIADDHLPELT